MTGEPAGVTSLCITCPSCGERYESPERAADILRNAGFCTNITCLHDLTAEPLEDAAKGRRSGNTRRSADRRAV
jgi:hypothetical protein